MLSERQWGRCGGLQSRRTAGRRSATTPQEVARARWGEDGILGISDDQQTLCFAPRAVEWPATRF